MIRKTAQVEKRAGDAHEGLWTFCISMLSLLHRLLQFFLVISKQSMNLAVGFVADTVNLWSKRDDTFRN